MELNQSIYKTSQLLTSLEYERWRLVLFSYQWWCLLFLLTISWVIWWLLVDKEQLFEVLSYALLVVIIGTTLDMYGIKLGLWSYPIKLFYLNPGSIAGDWAMPPVVKSLVYQHFRSWKKFILAQIVIAGFFAFVGEPFLVWIGVYRLYDWSYWKSFLVYIPVAIFSKWIIDGIKRRANKTLST